MKYWKIEWALPYWILNVPVILIGLGFSMIGDRDTSAASLKANLVLVEELRKDSAELVQLLEINRSRFSKQENFVKISNEKFDKSTGVAKFYDLFIATEFWSNDVFRPRMTALRKYLSDIDWLQSRPELASALTSYDHVLDDYERRNYRNQIKIDHYGDFILTHLDYLDMGQKPPLNLSEGKMTALFNGAADLMWTRGSYIRFLERVQAANKELIETLQT